MERWHISQFCNSKERMILHSNWHFTLTWTTPSGLFQYQQYITSMWRHDVCAHIYIPSGLLINTSLLPKYISQWGVCVQKDQRATYTFLTGASYLQGQVPTFQKMDLSDIQSWPDAGRPAYTKLTIGWYLHSVSNTSQLTEILVFTSISWW